ncbi:MAG: NAD(P)/FAD-dependent oxidoreductase [Candidatus Nitrosocosmicus sp.]
MEDDEDGFGKGSASPKKGSASSQLSGTSEIDDVVCSVETIKTPSTKEGDNNLIDDKNRNDDGTSVYDNVFDVAIIGGGYAGLSAALLLGRYLRPTIIFDVAKHRTSRIHGYLGFEKSPIREVVQKAWRDVLQYRSVKRVEEHVERVDKDYDNNLFVITTTAKKDDGLAKDDAIKRKAKAKYLIMATGVTHVQPTIKNFDEYLGNGIWHCPHCDGFETTDKKLVIVASDNKDNQALKYAKIFLGWTKDVTLFFQRPKDGDDDNSTMATGVGGHQLTDEQKNEAMTLGINVIESDGISEIVSDSGANKMKGVLTMAFFVIKQIYGFHFLPFHHQCRIRYRLFLAFSIVHNWVY